MTTSRPYLIRALYEWIVDNYLTPYIVVNAEYEGVEVPKQFVEAGRIILNVSPQATYELQLNNDKVTFSARFSGVSRDIVVPVMAVLAIYARENGRGMVFNEEDDTDEGQGSGTNDNSPPHTPKPPRGKPKLTIVK